MGQLPSRKIDRVKACPKDASNHSKFLKDRVASQEENDVIVDLENESVKIAEPNEDGAHLCS